MPSGSPTPQIPRPTLRPVEAEAPRNVQAINRWTNCETISKWAVATGWEVTPHDVNRAYYRYIQWYIGHYTNAYMSAHYGLKRRKS
jgi:hypothetical protein